MAETGAVLVTAPQPLSEPELPPLPTLEPIPAGLVGVVAGGLQLVHENRFATQTVEFNEVYLRWLVINAPHPDLVIGFSKELEP